MTTNLNLAYINLETLDTTVPIEHQWKYSRLTEDGNFPIHAFHYVFPNVALVTADGTVGEWVGVNTPVREIRGALLDGISKASEAAHRHVAMGGRMTDDAIALGNLLLEALELHLEGHLICIRWA